MTRDDPAIRNDTAVRGGRMRVARSRGMLSGLLLVLLGIWGALIPFIGPYFRFAYTPDQAWAWTWGRFWLEVLPGAAAILGGLMLIGTAHRAVGVFAGWLASVAGAWFVVGPFLSRLWAPPLGAAGRPIGGTTRQVFEQISFFYGLGAVILFLAAQALGRFTVRSVRDVAAAEAYRREPVVEEPAPVTRPVATVPAGSSAVERPAVDPDPTVSTERTVAPEQTVVRERTTPMAEADRERVAAAERERVAAAEHSRAAEAERERAAAFDGNRVATPPAETVEPPTETVEAPVAGRETTPVAGESNVQSHRAR